MGDEALKETTCGIAGIDDISLYVPGLFISATGEFARSRGIEPAKLTKGIGIERMAVPDAHEDAATMAASSIRGLMERNGLEPEDIGRIYIGTESGVDEAKAMGTYVIGMLERVYGRGRFQECATVEFKSACIAATHALENMLLWASRDREDRAGIVVASDIARYPLRSPGEYTQGAGSVAMLIKKCPRLLAIDSPIGIFTRDENDFFRPFGCTTAVVNGKQSNDCYIDAVVGAFSSYERKASGLFRRGPDECITDLIPHILFHIPYPRMVEYAASALFRSEWRSLPRWSAIVEETGEEPLPGDLDDPVRYSEALSSFTRRFVRSRPFVEAFRSKVEPSTMISRQVGNIYTGSIYLGLISLMEQGLLESGQRVLFGSYGSGCSASVFSGMVLGGVPPLGAMRRLDERREISLEEYEALHEGRRNESIIRPRGGFALVGVDAQGYRHYDIPG